jgi:tetraacyldisaccharide 4'-kinase
MGVQRIWEEYNRKKKSSFTWHLLRLVFNLLSYLFLLAYYLRVFVYRLGLIKLKKLEARVISVGNITLGGSGKTPLVIYIGERLKARGEDFAILTRGYKREGKEIIELKNKGLPCKKTGDEPYMLSGKLHDVPVLVHKNRFETGKEALKKYNTSIFILDDGFQHWRLERDVDIVMIDCLNPFGGDRLFPAGSLREPFSALKRADILVLNRVDQATNMDEIKIVLNRYNPDALKVESLYVLDSVKDFSDDSLVDIETLKDKKAIAFSGIANSFSFEKTLDQLGIKIERHFKFPDHFPYREKEIFKLEGDAINLDADILFTTEKDGVRMPKIDDLKIPIYIVSIKLKITKGEEDFWRILRSG